MAVYNQDMRDLAPNEKAAVFDLERFAIAVAREEALARATIRLLGRKFGEMPHGLEIAILSLKSDQLDESIDAMSSFRTTGDAQAWVAAATATFGS